MRLKYRFKFGNYWKLQHGFTSTTNDLVRGFTLVELILVMAIIAILTTFITGGLGSSQVKGRDAQRKSDLRQMASALELYYQDYGEYPAENNGVIIACPYDSGTGTGTNCAWGSSRFTDDKTLYLKILHKNFSVAATKLLTCSTDFLNCDISSKVSFNSITFSTPFLPSFTGTPTK